MTFSTRWLHSRRAPPSIHDATATTWRYLGLSCISSISPRKKEVMARRGGAYRDIPAVTQLLYFTPHWIVRYLVENSWRRLCVMNRPASKRARQCPTHRGEPRPDFSKSPSRESPGSIRRRQAGHMLHYAFDCSVSSTRRGLRQRDPALIPAGTPLRAEICPRAAQSSPSWRCVQGAGIVAGRFFQSSSWYGRRSSQLQNVAV